MSPFLPAEPAQVAECVAEAAAKRSPLSITGLGSKAALGRPVKNAGRLDLLRLKSPFIYPFRTAMRNSLSVQQSHYAPLFGQSHHSDIPLRSRD